MSIINVSVAIITDSSRRILITRRAFDIPHGGLWEVPGGKVEFGETPDEALRREIYEEVGLIIHAADFLGKVQHAYPEKKVCLHVFQVAQYTGAAACNDGQLELRWVSQEKLSDFKFPQANHAIMKLISLND